MFTVPGVCALLWIVAGDPVTPLAPPVVMTYPLRIKPGTEAGVTETFVRAPPRMLIVDWRGDWKKVFAEIADAKKESIKKEEQTENNQDHNESRTMEANTRPPQKADLPGKEEGPRPVEEIEDQGPRAHIHPDTPLSTDSEAGLEGKSIFIPSPEFEKQMISNLRRAYNIPDRSAYSQESRRSSYGQPRLPYSQDIPPTMQMNGIPEPMRGGSTKTPSSWNQHEDESALNEKLDEAFGLGGAAPFRSAYQRRPGSRFGERPPVPARIEEPTWTSWEAPKEHPRIESPSRSTYGETSPYKISLYGNGIESQMESSHYDSPMRREGPTSYGLNRPSSLRDTYHQSSYHGRISHDDYSPVVEMGPSMDPYGVGEMGYNGHYGSSNTNSNGGSRTRGGWMRDYY
eukprot:Protomagalhaensia_wolfi_Nauph_80__3508@NODE_355_length_2702_cov_97_562899_g267_i0_p1_GENE_NODE_355_length_2702_cov_97_562899_g267_i0NODE_355_length_2702_cov_97_562899_g267_i0_p1_ORF_typecomplete_len400_score64_55_NODE_355_length_2702_cov_97_562899_g267_i013782577